jgi:predicted alpha/beta-fold hydrolase
MITLRSSLFPDFEPHPLLRSGHLQTIWSALWTVHLHKYRAAQHLVPLDTEEKLVLHDDCPTSWSATAPCVLLLHGLGGCYASTYMVRLVEKLNQRGIRVFRMDMRGCGAGHALAVSPGHAGRSEDVRACVSRIREICPAAPIRIAGFSLGGNLVLKMLGEQLHQPGDIDRALAVSPPIDLELCAANISQYRIYDRAFVRSLCAQIRRRRRTLPQLRRLPITPQPRSIQEFDDRITAPLAGFRDSLDYYQRASAAPLLGRIDVPTTILAAADDPLIPVRMFSRPDLSPRVQVHVTRHGGHLGYIAAASDDPDRRWLDWRVVDWACD